MTARTSGWIYDLAECYTDPRWGSTSGHCWDRLEAIIGEYIRGERDRESARRLVLNTRTWVYADAAGLVFREQRPGSTIVSTIHCPACRCNGVSLAHVPNSSECLQDRFEREWSQADD